MNARDLVILLLTVLVIFLFIIIVKNMIAKFLV